MCSLQPRSATRRFATAVLATLALSFASLPILAANVEEPSTYRMEKYGAPVPATLKGARVVSTDEAEALWRAGDSIFIDVLPRPPKPDLPAGTVWREPPHSDIPGSVWLADVGYGGLTREMEDFYRSSLAELTGGDLSRSLVIYCRSNCWMSWNAAKRAVSWGYTGVTWYPGGVEEWEAAKLPREDKTPRRPGEAQ
jgi:PQQ-dependent catabolism-associated CXXCW motif protein